MSLLCVHVFNPLHNCGTIVLLLIIISSWLNFSYRSHYLIAYIVWSFVWIGFNVFIICFYLSVGDLQAEEDLLSFGTGSFSWWLINTPGCQPHYNTTVSPGNFLTCDWSKPNQTKCRSCRLIGWYSKSTCVALDWFDSNQLLFAIFLIT